MPLIGLAGKKFSGKNTAAEFIEVWASRHQIPVSQKGFADKLKLSACRIFYPDCSLEEAIQWADAIKILDKSTGSYAGYNDVTIGVGRNVSGYNAGSLFSPEYVLGNPDVEINGRVFLQRYGTEAHRDVFGDDFWVDALLPKGPTDETGMFPKWWENFFDPSIWDTHYDSLLGIVTDVRFPNEAERIRELDGIVLEVGRPSLKDEGDSHASETPLPRELVDEEIVNDGPLSVFQVEVESFMNNNYAYLRSE